MVELYMAKYLSVVICMLLHLVGFRVLCVSDVDKTVETLTSSRPVVEEFPFYMTVPLSGTPRHLAVNSDGSILSVCVSENGSCVIRFYDIQSFHDKVRLYDGCFSSTSIILLILP
jgi:hypothetical protein